MALKLATIIKKMSRFRNPFKYETYPVEILDIKPSPKIKSVYFKSGVVGANDIYQNYVQFFDVALQEQAEKGFVSVPAGSKTLWFKPLSVNDNRVKLYCKCPDMQFTFSFQLWEKDSFIGAYKKYTRVPGSTRPPRNPMEVPGYCKHVHSHLLALQKKGYLVGMK